MKKLSILSIAAIWSLSSSAMFAAALVINIDSGGLFLQNSAGIDLTGGATNTPFDGEVIQLGYFSGATSNDNNFSGVWIPITGEGSLNYTQNTSTDTSVGDAPGTFDPPNNQFAISLNFDTAAGQTIPPGLTAGTIMSIRIYDRNSLAASTSFMTLSSNLWKWPVVTSFSDPNSALSTSFADPGLRVENRLGAGGLVSTPNGSAAAPDVNGNLRTNVPIGPVIPEPSCSLLAIAGCAAFLARRRK